MARAAEIVTYLAKSSLKKGEHERTPVRLFHLKRKRERGLFKRTFGSKPFQKDQRYLGFLEGERKAKRKRRQDTIFFIRLRNCHKRRSYLSHQLKNSSHSDQFIYYRILSCAHSTRNRFPTHDLINEHNGGRSYYLLSQTI